MALHPQLCTKSLKKALKRSKRSLGSGDLLKKGSKKAIDPTFLGESIALIVSRRSGEDGSLAFGQKSLNLWSSKQPQERILVPQSRSSCATQRQQESPIPCQSSCNSRARRKRQKRGRCRLSQQTKAKSEADHLSHSQRDILLESFDYSRMRIKRRRRWSR